MFKRMIALFWCLLFVSAIDAGIVSFYVVDKNGNPIPGADVAISIDSGIARLNKTDCNGECRFKIGEMFPYDIDYSVSANGHKTYTQSDVLTQDQDYYITLD